MNSFLDYERWRALLFRLDAERSHELVSRALEQAQRVPAALAALAGRFRVHDPRLRRHVMGIDFPNPVGLAAGFDKNGRLIHAMAALGFGFVEVGTVTPRPQPGNPKPRLFRLAEERSLQNAMGFNNDGMAALHRRLHERGPFPIPIGINLGKNKSTPDSDAFDDYVTLLETLSDVGDYYVINVSSPNTPGLRDLQNEVFIKRVFTRAVEETGKPVLLKVSPDVDDAALIALCQTALDAGAAGIIATNTTVDYSLTPRAKDFGGISGALLKAKSMHALEVLVRELPDSAVIISVGGIDSPEEAKRRLEAGAALVQAYTGLIYEGPGFARKLNEALIYSTL